LNLSCVFGSVLESMLLADPSKNLFQQTASWLTHWPAPGSKDTELRCLTELEGVVIIEKRKVKNRGLLCEGVDVKFAFIAEHRGVWPAEWVCEALGVMAIWRRGKPDALLHHSDRGSQYTSEQSSG